MLDLTTTRGKIIDAALRLAATEGWRGLSLDKIARQAGVSLTEFRKDFSSKSDILAAYTRLIDDAVLAKANPADTDLAMRDRLFDVLMTRFELMQPYKAGLARIRDDLRFHPGESLPQLGVAARSLYWMLAAAGIDAEGSRGALRIPGLMALYGRVFEIWLDDDDPGLARTMAALDGRLRRGERFLQRVDDFGAAAMRFCASLIPSRTTTPSGEAQPNDQTTGLESPAPGQSNGSAGPGPAPAI